MVSESEKIISYSLLESERIRSIREWASLPTPDHARLLIRTYRESEWRSTRLEVLRHFGHFQDSRSLQFLIEIATKNEDLAEQQLAILALSQRRTRTAQVFLRRFYAKAPDTLKPHLAYALGQSQDFSAIPVLLKDWDVAYARQDWLWLRNMILALGELKAFEVLPRLRKLLEGAMASESELTFATLFALARLERDAHALQQFETRYVEDSLLYQIFQSTLSQVQIRSQFKLEDYLDKVFTSPDPHPILPLELQAFDLGDVEAGLSVFSVEKDWKRFMIALKGLPSKKRVTYLDQIIASLQTEEDQIEFLSTVTGLIDDENQDAVSKLLEPYSKSENGELRLKWLESIAHLVDLSKEAAFYFEQKDSSLAIRYLNLWSEWTLVKDTSSAAVAKTVNDWIQKFKLPTPVYARLIRACAELNVESKAMLDRFATDFKDANLRGSLLILLESFSKAIPLKSLLQEVTALASADKEALGQRLLAVFEAYALSGAKLDSAMSAQIDALLKIFSLHFNADLKVGVLRYLRAAPDVAMKPEYEKYVIEQAKAQDAMVELNAVVALKNYPDSRPASEALIEKLESPSSIIQGRALDGLCAHSSLISKRAVIEYLRTHLLREEVVDKIYRSFDPKNKGGEEFVKAIDQMLNANPDHPLWEKLVALRDRLSLAQAANADASNASAEMTEALREVDAQLTQVIPLFSKLDPTTQSALRAAEQPFMQALNFQNLPIDKAPTVLEYCKALDLILDRHLGQIHLFPKLDGQLHDFQTLWHRIGFGEDYPSAEKVMTALGLKGKITPEHFPLHKAKMMCGTFFNGKIVQDRFKVFDGLRAWAVIFLVFTRKIPHASGPIGPLIKLQNGTDEKCISVARRLMMLQDLRNPAAHRQTYTDLASVTHVRNEAIELLNTVLDLIV